MLFCAAGRGRGGRGGPDRDRYSSGRRDFGSFRDRDNDRGYDNGPKKAFGNKTQNGGGYGSNGSFNGSGANSYGGGGYSNNGQANLGAPFGAQNFQNQQFGTNQAGGMQNGMAQPQFPFNPQQQPPQPMAQPLMPFPPMPPSFPQ